MGLSKRSLYIQQLKSRGKYEGYLAKRAAYRKRIVDTPAKHALELEKKREYDRKLRQDPNRNAKRHARERA
jgi:hypothetical protein